MKFIGFMLISVVVAALMIKENFCVPAIRPSSKPGIIFPKDNWDDCFMDKASLVPGSCKALEECPEILKKWEKKNVYPKTCYFIKKQQFVCCPIPETKEILTTTEKLENIFDSNPTTIVSSNIDQIILDIFTTDPGEFATNPEFKDVPYDTTTTKKPSNVFLETVKNKTTSTTTISTKKPHNIFLENLNTQSTTQLNIIFDKFTTGPGSFTKRRAETECDLQNSQNIDFIETSEFPFMAVLGWKSEIDHKVWYPCGGILISPRFVLTAAHCNDIEGIKPTLVHLGDQNLTESAKGTIKIKQFIIHPKYNGAAFTNDIALVELEEEVDNSAACLWTQHDLPLTKFSALGYGRISFENANANQFFKADLKPIENAECQEIYKQDKKLKHLEIVETHLCAGDGENLRQYCQGDTGGPLIMKLEKVVYVVGLTSFGLGCADLPPSIFTRVASFIDWIEPIVWPQIDIRINNGK